VIRTDRFRISKRPYAVDLSSFNAKWHENTWTGEPPKNARKGTWHCTIQAVWFRRRSGLTVACVGYLWDIKLAEPADALVFLEAHDDGRYGGTTLGRWDGSGYWGSEVTLEEQSQHLEVLRPMLAGYPAIPPGYDGWWTF
jgi:hypothetical protein